MPLETSCAHVRRLTSAVKPRQRARAPMIATTVDPVWVTVLERRVVALYQKIKMVRRKKARKATYLCKTSITRGVIKIPTR